MASRSKREETGKYTVRWRSLRRGPDGKRRQFRQTCPDAATAAALQRQIDSAHALGREYVPAVDAASTIDGIIEAYLDDAERLVAKSTISTLRVALDIFVRWLRIERPRGPLHVDLLSGDRLAEWHGWLLREREFNGVKGLAPLSAQRYVQRVLGAWRWAYESERYGGEVPRPRAIRLPGARPKLTSVAPTWDQMDAVIAAAGELRAVWYQHLFIVLRFTGLRRNQAMRLRRSDLDVARGELVVRPELGKTRQERAGRVIPISPYLVELVSGWPLPDRWTQEQQARDGTDWLIDAPAKRVIDNDRTKTLWDAVQVPADVARQPCHAFRKGFVSGLAKACVPEQTIKALVGHDLGITGEIYTSVDVRMEAMRAAIDKVPPLRVLEPRQVAIDFAPGRRQQS